MGGDASTGGPTEKSRLMDRETGVGRSSITKQIDDCKGLRSALCFSNDLADGLGGLGA